MHRDQVISVLRQSQLFGGLDDVRLIASPPRSDVMLAEQQAGVAGPAGQPTIDLPLTRTDMANMVGGSRQSVNQILSSFAARGLIELRGRTIVLRHLDQLHRRAGL